MIEGLEDVKKLGLWQRRAAQELTEKWGRSNFSSFSNAETVYESLVKYGIIEIDKKGGGHPAFWAVRRGPKWIDYAWQWATPACGYIRHETLADRENERLRQRDLHRAEAGKLVMQIVEEAGRLADGKNDPGDLYDLVKARRIAEEKAAALDTGPKWPGMIVFTTFTDGEVIRTEVDHGWMSQSVVDKIIAAYVERFNRPCPGIESFDKIHG